MAETLTKVDLVILDELGYLPFSSILVARFSSICSASSMSAPA